MFKNNLTRLKIKRFTRISLREMQKKKKNAVSSQLILVVDVADDEFLPCFMSSKIEKMEKFCGVFCPLRVFHLMKYS